MIDRNELQNKALKESQQGVQSAQSENVQSTQVSKIAKPEPAGAPNVQSVQLPKLQQVTASVDSAEQQTQSTQAVQEDIPNVLNISSTLDTSNSKVPNTISSNSSNVTQVDASNTPDSPHIHAQHRTVRAPRESNLETQTNAHVSSNESSDISTNGTDSIQDNINQLQSKLYTNKKKRVLTWIMWGSFALIWIIFLGLGFTVYKTHSMSVLNKTWLPVIVAEFVAIVTLIVSKGMLHHQVKLVRKIKELLILQSLPN